MPRTSSSPRFRGLPPGHWTLLAWAVGAALTFLMRIRLPGESQPSVLPGVLLYRYDGMLFLLVATLVTIAGARRLDRRPVIALALLLTGSVIATIPLSVGEIPMAQFLAVDVALYFVAAAGPRRTGNVALGLSLATLVGFVTVRLLSGWPAGISAELAVALTAVVAALLGGAARQAREHAEAARAQAAAQAVTAERLRIARELHDMVAHSIGVIALQAGAAGRVIDTQPALARAALGEIETAGRETLSGLRRMLGALRRSEPGAAPLTPGLGLADVDRLAASTTAAGVRVDVRWLGDPGPLPPEIDVSAYRIIQEAVTNVVRHAGTATCQVTVDRRSGEELAIEVLDAGEGTGGTGATGWGLIGMRERIALLHGEFTAGPLGDGGFRVTARLPVPEGVR
ncbi:sensor histidine kinase [Streptomyces hainanensis]|uniref:histidine kinase n=1 Tax=Streptomyces hainanensis TaxID=402648 RepID=A0A4R4T4I1_9ACTN|nr:histidine kinase [Streptomyces hainanensis]TDC69269.1 sensor histidine kinase [Streptomyces hainanensis]